MSLDVYLEVDKLVQQSHSGIFIREDGQTKEISQEEWNEKFPNRKPMIVVVEPEEINIVFEWNITHNLNEMAGAANIYTELWRPEELGYTKASQLIQPLQIGYELLLADPKFFKKFNPPNRWGNYEGLVEFVKKYLEACKQYPDAVIRISR